MSWKYRKKINDYLTAVADDSYGEIWVYGDIVDDAWWDDEVSPKTVRDALQDMGNVATVNIRVNSYGGSVYAGNAIINILDSYRRKTGCKIVAYIEGIAASMGSGIPMVADKIYMAENAMYMLHKPWSIAMGNSDDIGKTVGELQKAEDTLVVNYMRKFNGTEDELRQMLADETWLTADEALEWGLCDEIIEAVPIAASAKGIRINNREFVANAGKIAAKFTPGTPLAKASYSANEAIPKIIPQPADTFRGYLGNVNCCCNNSSALSGNSIYVGDNYNGMFRPYTTTINTTGFSQSYVPATTINPPVPKSKKEGEPKMFVYDEALNEFGITEEAFKTLNMDAKQVLDVCNAVKRPVTDSGTAEAYITSDMVKTALGEDMSAENVLALAKAGKAVEPDADAKAKAYDKMVKNAIDVAIQNGIRAKGDKFNEAKWKKTLESWDYDEIIEQSTEWNDEAKDALNAGKRISQPWKQNPNSEHTPIDPKNYNFC